MSGLGAALFGPVQLRLLGLLFGQPGRRFQSSEIIRLVEGGTGAAHRQLQRLERAGLIVSERAGNQKHYRANQASPIFPEIHGLVLKTVGVVEPLRLALSRVVEDIEVAFVFGSVAKGTDDSASDLDLLVIADGVSYADVYEALHRAEIALARPVNPTVMTRSEWMRKKARRDSFVSRVAAQPKIFVVGNDDDLG